MKTIGFFIVVLVILSIFTAASGRPAKSQSLSRQKRQSDQRLAELETLLALQKYGRHRFRMDRKKGAGADGQTPGYGIIDFRMLGRKKKSTRFSPGESASSIQDDQPTSYQLKGYHPRQRQDSLTVSSEDVENIYPVHDPISDQDSPSRQTDPFLYIEKK